jgi:hypothetical protein
MRDYLERYGMVATHLERMSDLYKNAKSDLVVARADANEWMATSNEFRKAAEMNSNRCHKLKELLREVVNGANGMCGLVEVGLLTRIMAALEGKK